MMKHNLLPCGNRPYGVALVAAALLAGFLAGTDAAGVELVLRSTANPRSRTVRLGDVATIQNTDGANARRLAELPLMPAPSPGSSHTLRASDVRDHLAVLGEDVAILDFLGAQTVKIGDRQPETATERSTPGQSFRGGPEPTLSAANDAVVQALTQGRSAPVSRNRRQHLVEELERLVLVHVQQQTGDSEGWEVELQATHQLVRQLATAESQPQVVGGAPPWSGRQQFLVNFLDESDEARMPVVAVVSKQEPVVVARLPIEANRLITRSAVDIEYRSSKNRRSTGRSMAQELDEVLGRVARRSLRPGDPIYLDQIQAPLFVHRGDVVQAIARGGGIEVRTYAKARNDGLPGDVIEVESTHGDENFYAKVVGQGKVEVYAGGSGSPAPRRQQERITVRPGSSR